MNIWMNNLLSLFPLHPYSLPALRIYSIAPHSSSPYPYHCNSVSPGRSKYLVVRIIFPLLYHRRSCM